MKTAGKRKITTGFVIQTFNDDNKCTEQEFVAGDQVDFEDENGNPIDSWNEYQPFDMVQPGQVQTTGVMATPPDTVQCKFCKKQVPRDTAHSHGPDWVGDECCWDERLRSSE